MRSVPLLSLLVFGITARGLAQAPPPEAQRRWLVQTGGTFIRLDDYLTFGPSAAIRGMLGHRIALTLEGSVLLTGFGPYDQRPIALMGSFGPSWVWRGARQEYSVSLGVTALTEWKDQSFPVAARVQSSTVGVHAAGGGVIWLGSTVGLSGTFKLHLWWGDPGGSATLGVAFRW